MPVAWAPIGWHETPQAVPDLPHLPRVDVAQLLAAWRVAERQLDDLIETSPMRKLVQAEADRLRAQYHRVFEDRIRSQNRD